MGFNKGHMEFTTLNLTEGFHDVPGYPPGFSERIIAGSLDEKTKTGNRTRILRIEPGAFSTVPFVHAYWEEVFLITGFDLWFGCKRKGRRTVQRCHILRAAPWGLSRAIHIEDGLLSTRDTLLRREVKGSSRQKDQLFMPP